MGSIEKEVGVTRKVRYNYDDYLNFILHEGPIDHDYQFGTTEEDQRILALFDLERGGEDGDGDYNQLVLVTFPYKLVGVTVFRIVEFFRPRTVPKITHVNNPSERSAP